ncbi:metallophosphoesterase family protein [Haloprofundus halophilus]|uniref:metallophosphoesterase family protein n=1 Tax=Haloprofundus halophilus TaxID=2283527 RepID=UPI000E451292|nr:metallophosphoesterase [Haloprofundus halophilus]
MSGPTRETELAHLDRPKAPETTLAVVSDAHVTADAEGTWKVFHRTESRLESVVDDVNRRDVDGLVFAGDLTKDGAPPEFDRVEEILSELDAPYLAVPGNHDVPKAFDDHQTPPLSSFVAAHCPDELPYRSRLGGLDVVCLNSASDADGTLREGHAGRISDAQLDWIADAVDPERPTVAVFHHPTTHVGRLVERFPDTDHYQLRNADAVVEALDSAGVELAVSGHIHWPTAARVSGVSGGSDESGVSDGRPRGGRADSFDGVTQVTTPAACSFPQGYLLVRVTPDGTTVSMVPLGDDESRTEAYRHAAADGARNDAIVESADDGYFDSFPLVDERAPEPPTSD